MQLNYTHARNKSFWGFACLIKKQYLCIVIENNMRIVDKKKDYYDFLVGKFGMDEKCVYVRNGVDIQAYIDYNMQSYYGTNALMAKKLWRVFKKEPIITPTNMLVGRERPMYDDAPLSPNYNPMLYVHKPFRNEELELHKGYSFYCTHVNLIVGNTRYYLEALRYLNTDGTLHYDMQLEKRKLVERKSVEPIYFDFGSCSKDELEHQGNRYIEQYYAENIIENPLLKSTFIPSIIPPETIWIDVENYISSLNNDKVHDNMTNKEKILSHGFDLKTSFRNVK